MKIYYTLFFVLIFSELYSQDSFELTIQTEENQYSSTVFENNQGDFILLASPIDSNNKLNGSYLYQISREGQIVKEKYINPYKTECAIMNLLEMDYGYLGFGHISKEETNTADFWFIQLDYDFDILSEKSYTGLSDVRFQGMDYLAVTDSTIAFFNTYMFNGSMKSVIRMYELTLDGDTLQTKNYFEDDNMIIYALNVTKSNDEMINLHLDAYSFDLDNGQPFIAKLNPEYDIDEIYEQNFMLHWEVKNYQQNKYLYAGLLPLGGVDEWNLGLKKVDENNEVVKENDFGYLFRNDHIAWNQGISFSNNNSVYLCAYTFYDDKYHVFDTLPNVISLYNVDADLEINWVKYYIKEDAFYQASYISATNDGGAIIASTRYDFNEERRFDIYILKVDSLGNYTPTGIERPKISSTELIAYPNPGIDYLKIRAALPHTDTFFELYDINVQMILRERITQSESVFDMRGQKSGVYFYRYLRKGKVIETGKWLKQ